MKQEIRRIVGLAVLVITFPCVLHVYAGDSAKGYYSQVGKFSIPFGRKYDYNSVLVKRVIDGDTLLLETGERVRLIGIDTPEMHDSDKLYRDSRRMKQDVHLIKQLGYRAYEFTRRLAQGQLVRLEFDTEKHDKYNRLLAYVYLKDGSMLNARIIEEGYASLMTIPPNIKYADLFFKLYHEARESRRGLWR